MLYKYDNRIYGWGPSSLYAQLRKSCSINTVKSLSDGGFRSKWEMLIFTSWPEEEYSCIYIFIFRSSFIFQTRWITLTIQHDSTGIIEYRELYESVEYLCRKRQCDRIQSNSKYVFPQYVSGNYVHNFRILKVVSESKESVIESTCVDNNHHACRIEYDKRKSAWDELHC